MRGVPPPPASGLPFPFPTVRWEDGAVVLLDQTRLPGELAWRRCANVPALCQAIRELAVRGAPALGVAAAYGLALAWETARRDGAAVAAAAAALREARRQLAATRPTAVNLFWALERVGTLAEAAARPAGASDAPPDPAVIGARLLAAADAILADDLARGRALGEAGAALLPDPAAVLTHCNAGGLATGGFGTALGVVYAAAAAGKRVRVYADETRPLLQGARLTAWELAARGVPVTVLCDGAAGSLLRSGAVDAVVVGADRIARNGDAANKIGTYPLAVLAARHGVPFYVAAPASTYDPEVPAGEGIAIEQRPAAEVLACAGRPAAPAGVEAYNPAFDVTPAALITAFITEIGVLKPPFPAALAPLAAARAP